MNGKLLTAVVLFAFAGALIARADEAATEKQPEAKAPAVTQVFVCDKCHSAEMKAGKCPGCGDDMKGMHLLAIKDGKACCCTCAADCKCEMKAGDMDNCSCGKPIGKASLKGKYICGCGEDCKCNTISAEPGKCHCGKDLKKVE